MIPYNRNLTQYARKLRNNQTIEEGKLWNYLLRDRQLNGYKFTRQKPILNYIVDFFCAKLLLVIEVDGKIHDYMISKDNNRSNHIEALGIKIVRYSNDQIQDDLDKVRTDIIKYIRIREKELLYTPFAPPCKGENKEV